MSVLTNLAEAWSQWIWPLLQFLIGLNVVVFVHELGHFLMARRAGIKVERFALGMGPRLIGVKTEETDYCLCALPLGGYVKMLGQEDFKPLEEGDEPNPRSFQAKSIGKRFGVIAAGVVMNVILAAVLFIAISMIGMDFPAPVVGETVPLFPAAEAKVTWEGPAPPADPLARRGQEPNEGLRPGDIILRMEGGGFFTRVMGESTQRFTDIMIKAAMADLNDRFELVFVRTQDGKEYTGRMTVGVRMNPTQGSPAMGISPASSLTVLAPTPNRDDILPGDRIIAVDGTEVQHARDLQAVEHQLSAEPVPVTLLRETPEGNDETVTIEVSPKVLGLRDFQYLTSGERVWGYVVADPDGQEGVTYTTADGEEVKVASDEILLQTPDGQTRTIARGEWAGGNTWSLLDVLGLSPRLMVQQVEESSPAANAEPQSAQSADEEKEDMKLGLRREDIIVEYGDVLTPTFREFKEISERVEARDGNNDTTSITVLRNGNTLRFSIEPASRYDEAVVGVVQTIDRDHLVVANIRTGSPAEQAGIPEEAEILAVNDQSVDTWEELVAALSALEEGTDVTLTCRHGGQEKTYDLGPLGPQQYRSSDYVFQLLPSVVFEPLEVNIAHRNPLSAVVWGARETFRMGFSAYGTIAALIRGSVQTDAIRGPIGIGEAGIVTARQGIMHLVHLIALLSAAVAVFNFLPLPVLDGGLAVLLLVEKIRGKPLPTRVVNIIQMTGLVLILGLIILITWQDIARLFRNYVFM